MDEDVCHVINNPPSPLAKRKRTKRLRPHSPAADRRRRSSDSGSTTTTEEEQETARSLILLAQGHFSHDPGTTAAVNGGAGAAAYTCKTCDRVFSSFQALGGHRTSHKKPKPGERPDSGDVSSSKKINTASYQPHSLALKLGGPFGPRMHECSYCGAGFSSGQALGGHMRRHRVAPVKPDPGPEKTRNGLSLDLNFPAPEDENPRFEFGSGRPGKMAVRTNGPALVDCHF